MIELKQETELRLSKTQVQNVINDYTKRKNVLNNLFSLIINSLILSAHQVFLHQNEAEKYKGNVTEKLQGPAKALS